LRSQNRIIRIQPCLSREPATACRAASANREPAYRAILMYAHSAQMAPQRCSAAQRASGARAASAPRSCSSTSRNTIHVSSASTARRTHHQESGDTANRRSPRTAPQTTIPACRERAETGTPRHAPHPGRDRATRSRQARRAVPHRRPARSLVGKSDAYGCRTPDRSAQTSVTSTCQ